MTRVTITQVDLQYILVKVGGFSGALKIPLAGLSMVLAVYYFRHEVHSIMDRLGLEKKPRVFNTIMEKLRKRLSPAGIYGLFDEVEDHKAIVGQHGEELKDHNGELQDLR